MDTQFLLTLVSGWKLTLAYKYLAIVNEHKVKTLYANLVTLFRKYKCHLDNT